MYEKLKNFSIQSFKECLFFIFCLFCFLLLSNNTLHVILWTYVRYWNTFQYKYVSASDFQRYFFTLYHIISLPISVYIYVLKWSIIHCVNLSKNSTPQKMKFSIKDFFSKCDKIRRNLQIWSNLLKKSLMDIFIFCAVAYGEK